MVERQAGRQAGTPFKICPRARRPGYAFWLKVLENRQTRQQFCTFFIIIKKEPKLWNLITNHGNCTAASNQCPPPRGPLIPTMMHVFWTPTESPLSAFPENTHRIGYQWAPWGATEKPLFPTGFVLLLCTLHQRHIMRCLLMITASWTSLVLMTLEMHRPWVASCVHRFNINSIHKLELLVDESRKSLTPEAWAWVSSQTGDFGPPPGVFTCGFRQKSANLAGFRHFCLFSGPARSTWTPHPSRVYKILFKAFFSAFAEKFLTEINSTFLA